MLGPLRAALRVLGILLVFLFVIPAHLVGLAFGRKDLVPPVFLWLMGRISGLRVRSTGTPRKGALFVSNHESWLDIFALAGETRSKFVAHSGLAQPSVLRWLCDQNDTVFITRDRRQSVSAQVDQVRAALGERPVTIFPEATTNDGTALLPFRSSLLSAVEPLAGEMPIQPVALDYTAPAEIAWFGDEPGLRNFYRVVSRPGRIELTLRFLEPLSGEALADRKAMTAAAEAAVRGALHL